MIVLKAYIYYVPGLPKEFYIISPQGICTPEGQNYNSMVINSFGHFPLLQSDYNTVYVSNMVYLNAGLINQYHRSCVILACQKCLVIHIISTKFLTIIGFFELSKNHYLVFDQCNRLKIILIQAFLSHIFPGACNI